MIDHLEPIHSLLDSPDYEQTYHTRLKEKLCFNLKTDFKIRFLILPSFQPEQILISQYDGLTGQHSLVHRIVEKPIWQNANWEQLNIRENRKVITQAQLQSITTIFNTALYEVRYPRKKFGRLDGIYFYFSTNNYGIKSGKTWSPEKGTKMSKLVEFGYQLIEFTHGNIEILNQLDHSI